VLVSPIVFASSTCSTFSLNPLSHSMVMVLLHLRILSTLREEQLERITYGGMARQRKLGETGRLYRPPFLNLKRLSSEE